MLFNQIKKSIAKNGLYMALYYRWRDIASIAFFNQILIDAHRLLWSRSRMSRYVKHLSVEDKPLGNVIPRIIWIFWYQGLENAPEIVKECINSIKSHCPDYKIIVLDETNLEKYVVLPDIIQEKMKSKAISMAHYSDMVRLSVLLQNGGIWMDSTCYMTGPMPSYIERSSFFMFKSSQLDSVSVKMSNWFIKSPQSNPLLSTLNDLLVEYHKTNKNVKDYFVFHQLLTLLLEENEMCKNIWQDIPYVCNMNPHVLQFSLADKYSEDRFSEIKHMSSIHKLTYKFELPVLQNPENFYNCIFNK